MFPHSITRARGQVPEMLYIFVLQSVYKSLLSNEIKSRVLRQTEKTPQKKSLTGMIYQQIYQFCHYILHQVACIDCSAPGGKQHDSLTGVWGIESKLSQVQVKAWHWTKMTPYGFTRPHWVKSTLVQVITMPIYQQVVNWNNDDPNLWCYQASMT